MVSLSYVYFTIINKFEISDDISKFKYLLETISILEKQLNDSIYYHRAFSTPMNEFTESVYGKLFISKSIQEFIYM
jgi:hypothetical protein